MNHVQKMKFSFSVTSFRISPKLPVQFCYTRGCAYHMTNFRVCVYDFFPWRTVAPPPPMGQGLLNIDASLSQPHLVGLFWMSDQPDTVNFTSDNTTLTTDRNPGTRPDSNPQSQEAIGRRPTPRMYEFSYWQNIKTLGQFRRLFHIILG